MIKGIILSAIVLLLVGCNSKEDIPKSEAEIKAERVAETKRPRVRNNTKDCKELEQKLNWNWTMPVSKKFLALDCDSVLGASTREARVNEIREAFKEY